MKGGYSPHLYKLMVGLLDATRQEVLANLAPQLEAAEQMAKALREVQIRMVIYPQEVNAALEEWYDAKAIAIWDAGKKDGAS